jgi:hypothetical protein
VCRGIDANDEALREMVVGIGDRSRAGKGFSGICSFSRNEILRRDLPARPRLHRMAVAQDRIGWRRFMEGMICTQVVEIQHTYQRLCGTNRTRKSWATGLVINLMEITHGQWLYCNVVLHDSVLGALVTKRKEEIQQEIEKQQSLGPQDLQEEDQYLAEVNLED